MMKRMQKILVGMCMALVLSLYLAPLAVQAAEINVTLGTTDNGTAGSDVTARIVLSNNPGISTFAMKLAYDSNYLTYNSDATTWANSIAGNTNNMVLVSEVTENGGPVINMSFIPNATYSNNETIVTLHFTVKQAYTTMPVTLSNRELTDTSYNPVTVNILVDATAGPTPADTESQAPSQSEDNSQENGGSQTDGGNNNNNNSNNNNNNGNNNNSNNNNNSTANSSAGSDKNGLDRTPKTGAWDIRYLLAGAIVLFVVIAGICIKVLGRKKTS